MFVNIDRSERNHMGIMYVGLHNYSHFIAMDSMDLARLIAQPAWHDRYHESYSSTGIQQLASRNQDSQLPYKSLIGQVILDKNKSAAGLRSAEAVLRLLGVEGRAVGWRHQIWRP